MGIVYRAEDEKLRRPVALKVLPVAFAQDDERRRRFLREARSAAALTHANIGTVYEVGEDGWRVFISMELVEGQSLRERIAGGRMPSGEAIRIARGIARGLGRAHAKGIVHRDLKPENVVLDADGEPKILDFGLAKLREVHGTQDPSAIERLETESVATEEGRALGTPAYMSPEQARGGFVDARSDVFSLGVLLHEMLAGRRPFEGASSAEILAAILRDAPEPLARDAPDAPKGLVALVERCLAKAPRDRWRDASDLLQALEALEARPRSRPWLLGALLLATAIAGTVGVGLLSRRPVAVATGTIAPPASQPAPPRVHAMTDWPAPHTSSPEAAALYAEALQALRNASFELMKTDLQRAVELDPHFAAAHVRLAIIAYGAEEARVHIAAAAQGRVPLSDRDQRILMLAKADHLDERAIPTQGLAEARRLAEALPDDPEALFWAAATIKWHVPEEALPLIERALTLDPQFAVAAYMREEIADLHGDVDAMLAADERCLAIHPEATVCILGVAQVHSIRGQCADMERYARRAIAVEPSSGWGHTFLFWALEATDAPPDALRQLTGKVALYDPLVKKLAADQAAADLSLYVGDFDGAEAALLTRQKDEEAETVEDRHVSERMLVELYDEEGAPQKAAALAEAYLRRLPAWSHELPNPVRVSALAALGRTGKKSPAQVKALREEWRAEWTPQERSFPSSLWFSLYAAPAATPAEAREALDALPSFAPLRPLGSRPRDRGALGAVYALVGDADHAIPELRAAVTWCGASDELLVSMRWRLLLGRMLEQTSDREGACAEYGTILHRWGEARPRSVTADAARVRSKALRCK
jgi:serine/threonine-protein kinase